MRHRVTRSPRSTKNMQSDSERSSPTETNGWREINLRWGLRISSLAAAGLMSFLILWNLVLVVTTYSGMPRNDFGRPLLATRAFLDGQDMYRETEAVVYRLNPTTVIHLWDLNPPHSHLLYVPLAVLPKWLALTAWFVLGGLCLYESLRVILSELGLTLNRRQKEWLIIWLLSFSAMGVAVLTVHLTFPLMLLVTLSWREARHGRWFKAGSWLGVALSIKPFLLIFLPYLVLKRNWRGIAGIGTSTLLSFLVGVVIFGVESHRSWLEVLGRADSWAWLPLNASLMGMMSRVFTTTPVFTPMALLDPGQIRMAWLLLGIPAGTITLVMCLTDSTTRGIDRAFGLLLVSALLLSPLGWIYYFWLPVGPIAAIARNWWIEHSRRDENGRLAIGSPSWYLFLASMIGMLSPPIFCLAFQPLAVATLLVANVHFWSLLLIWLALLFDKHDLRHTIARVLSVRPVDSLGLHAGPKPFTGGQES